MSMGSADLEEFKAPKRLQFLENYNEKAPTVAAELTPDEVICL